MNELFFKKNIDKKKEYIQDEHKAILDAVYKNALDMKCVEKFTFVPNVCQCMTFTEIFKITNLDFPIVLTCLRDLENMGFVINVMLNPNKEYSYAITWLGLKYMELKNN